MKFSDVEQFPNEWLNTVTHEDISMNTLPAITDRDEADLQLLYQMRSIKWENMTPQEQAQWMGVMKGAYNADDLNRVGYIVNYVRDYLNGLQGVLNAWMVLWGVAPDEAFSVPYGPLSITGITTWPVDAIPNKSDMATYLDNVKTVTDALDIQKQLPETMDFLTVIGANEIERALLSELAAGEAFEEEKKQWIVNAAAAWYYCGEVYGGEVTA